MIVIVSIELIQPFVEMLIHGTGLPYKSPLQPYAAWTTLVALIVVILTSGYSVFFPGRWQVSSFLTYYIDIAIFIRESIQPFITADQLTNRSALGGKSVLLSNEASISFGHDPV